MIHIFIIFCRFFICHLNKKTENNLIHGEDRFLAKTYCTV